MATKNILIISMLSLFVVFTSCKDKVEGEPCDPEVTQLKVSVQPVYGAETLHLDSVYSTAEGYDIKFTDLKFLAEDVRGTSSQLNDAALFDYRLTGTDLFTGEGDPADFSSLTGNLGVQSSINHDDPSAFPNESALNILNIGGMHWGWNPGYIFMKVEARVDTIPDGIPLFDRLVVFHIGKDANLETLSFSSINWQQSGDLNYNFPLKLDMQTFLQNGTETIDLKTEYTSHSASGQEALSTKVIQNFKAALSEL